MIKNISILLLCVASLAHGTETSSEIKNNIYGSCYADCSIKSKTTSWGIKAADNPFLIQGYCSCFCSRLSMQMNLETVNQMDAAVRGGRNLGSIPAVQQLVVRNGEVCYQAILAK